MNFQGSLVLRGARWNFPIIRRVAGSVRFANLSFLSESNLRCNGDSGWINGIATRHIGLFKAGNGDSFYILIDSWTVHCQIESYLVSTPW